MQSVFADTDILLDLLSQREPFYNGAASLFSLADKKKIKVFVSSLSFANLHYLLTRQNGNAEAKKILMRLKLLVTVCEVNDKIISLALTSKVVDFEDAVQYHTALENKIPVFLTRNLKDYKKSAMPVMTAETYVKAV